MASSREYEMIKYNPTVCSGWFLPWRALKSQDKIKFNKLTFKTSGRSGNVTTIAYTNRNIFMPDI